MCIIGFSTEVELFCFYRIILPQGLVCLWHAHRREKHKSLCSSRASYKNKKLKNPKPFEACVQRYLLWFEVRINFVIRKAPKKNPALKSNHSASNFLSKLSHVSCFKLASTNPSLLCSMLVKRSCWILIADVSLCLMSGIFQLFIWVNHCWNVELLNNLILYCSHLLVFPS